MTDETRNPMTGEQALIDIMTALNVNNPTDAVRAVADLTQRVGVATDPPLLTVTREGQIVYGDGLTVAILARLADTLANMPISTRPK